MDALLAAHSRESYPLQQGKHASIAFTMASAGEIPLGSQPYSLSQSALASGHALPTAPQKALQRVSDALYLSS